MTKSKTIFRPKNMILEMNISERDSPTPIAVDNIQNSYDNGTWKL